MTEDTKEKETEPGAAPPAIMSEDEERARQREFDLIKERITKAS